MNQNQPIARLQFSNEHTFWIWFSYMSYTVCDIANLGPNFGTLKLGTQVHLSIYITFQTWTENMMHSLRYANSVWLHCNGTNMSTISPTVTRLAIISTMPTSTSLIFIRLLCIILAVLWRQDSNSNLNKQIVIDINILDYMLSRQKVSIDTQIN